MTARACEQEICGNWTGEGCACAVLGVEPNLMAAPGTSCADQDHPDEGDGCCRCGMVCYYDAPEPSRG